MLDTAIIGGSDTASTALSHLCYFLLGHPHCMARLRAEVNEFFPPNDTRGANGIHLRDKEGPKDGEVEVPFDPGRQAEMPYLNACM